MPGRRLSKNEHNLLRFWENPPNNLQRPLLRAIEIGGSRNLRALDGIRIPFNYPITAICGKNGTGKSTILALSALAFHTPTDWYVPWTNARYRSSRSSEDRSYYIFSDFFVYGNDEEPPNGVQITWRYIQGGVETSVDFTKTERRWGIYSRRPEREIAYSPLSRFIPAHEMNSVRGTFRQPGSNVQTIAFDAKYRNYLAYIMGTTYEATSVQRTDKLNFAQCRTTLPYSSFNMGGGEVSVIALLHLLRTLPNCALLVIEEIESCLHPEAQVRLAKVLIEISCEKRIQIVCSTHSEVFLDSLPRQARLLLTRHDRVNEVIEYPSTRFAIYEMKGEVQPELTIYCEDTPAAILIEEAVAHTDRCRLRIKDVGSNITVIRQAVSHIRGGFAGDCLCILDGDCSTQSVREWINSEIGGDTNLTPKFEILPGSGLPPERWVLDQLVHEDYRNQFADQLVCPRDLATEYVNSMRVELDHHSMAHALQMRTGFEESECIRRIIRSVTKNHPALEPMKRRISNLLE